MKLVITNRKFETSDKMRAIIERKISKLDKFFPSEVVANVTLSTRRTLARIEITIFYKGTIFRAEEENEDAVTALYEAVELLERQIRKNKTKLAKRLRENAFEEFMSDGSLDDFEEDAINITKVKNFTLTEMSPEDAVLQMNLLGHSFYMFKNIGSGEINLVYSREGGEYGLIVPTEEE